MYKNYNLKTLLWVASDGVTVVRLSDLASVKIYCAETGWPESDFIRVVTPARINKQGFVEFAPFMWVMDPEVGEGKWDEYGSWEPNLSESYLAEVGEDALEPNPPNIKRILERMRTENIHFREAAARLDNGIQE